MKCLDTILENEMEREDSVDILCDNNDPIDIIIGDDEESIFGNYNEKEEEGNAEY